jgi:hypothetical protein
VAARGSSGLLEFPFREGANEADERERVALWVTLICDTKNVDQVYEAISSLHRCRAALQSSTLLEIVNRSEEPTEATPAAPAGGAPEQELEMLVEGLAVCAEFAAAAAALPSEQVLADLRGVDVDGPVWLNGDLTQEHALFRAAIGVKYARPKGFDWHRWISDGVVAGLIIWRDNLPVVRELLHLALRASDTSYTHREAHLVLSWATRRHAHDREALRCGLRMLAYVCLDRDRLHTEAPIVAGIIASAASALRGFGGDEEVEWLALLALQSIDWEKPCVTNPEVESALVPLLVGLLERHATPGGLTHTDLDLQEQPSKDPHRRAGSALEIMTNIIRRRPELAALLATPDTLRVLLVPAALPLPCFANASRGPDAWDHAEAEDLAISHNRYMAWGLIGAALCHSGRGDLSLSLDLPATLLGLATGTGFWRSAKGHEDWRAGEQSGWGLWRFFVDVGLTAGAVEPGKLDVEATLDHLHRTWDKAACMGGWTDYDDEASIKARWGGRVRRWRPEYMEMPVDSLLAALDLLDRRPDLLPRLSEDRFLVPLAHFFNFKARGHNVDPTIALLRRASQAEALCGLLVRLYGYRVAQGLDLTALRASLLPELESTRSEMLRVRPAAGAQESDWVCEAAGLACMRVLELMCLADPGLHACRLLAAHPKCATYLVRLHRRESRPGCGRAARSLLRALATHGPNAFTLIQAGAATVALQVHVSTGPGLDSPSASAECLDEHAQALELLGRLCLEDPRQELARRVQGGQEGEAGVGLLASLASERYNHLPALATHGPLQAGRRWALAGLTATNGYNPSTVQALAAQMDLPTEVRRLLRSLEVSPGVQAAVARGEEVLGALATPPPPPPADPEAPTGAAAGIEPPVAGAQHVGPAHVHVEMEMPAEPPVGHHAGPAHVKIQVEVPAEPRGQCQGEADGPSAGKGCWAWVKGAWAWVVRTAARLVKGVIGYLSTCFRRQGNVLAHGPSYGTMPYFMV